MIDTSRKTTTVALMGKAVQFGSYGDVDVLEVRDVSRPVPGADEVLVEFRRHPRAKTQHLRRTFDDEHADG
jgi:hypothetical protein